MRRGAMKKLILIPTVIVTVFLAFAFLMPATASGLVKTVAPALQTGHVSVLGIHLSQAGVASSSGSAPSSSTQTARSVSQGSSIQSTTTTQTAAQNAIIDPASHEVATSGHSNCGRFGDGFHGGKHDFTCPNRPFPAS
jgi:hypothetical protein